MNKSVEELVKYLDERGLSTNKFTRIEATDGKPVPRTYIPAADIVNLFPALLSAAINDLEADYSDVLVDKISMMMLKRLLPYLYEKMPDKDGNYGELVMKVIDKLHVMWAERPEAMDRVAYNFLMFSLIAYAIACKNGLREMPTVMGGDGVFRYFAMLAVWDKLKPETQKAVWQDLKDQNLWGADPDAY